MIHRRLLQLVGVVAGPVVLMAALSTLVSACHIAGAVLAATVLADLTGGNLTAVPPAIAVLVGVVVVRAVLLWSREVTAARFGIAIRTRLRGELLRRITQLGPGWTQGGRAGAITHTVVDGVEALDAYYSRYLPQLIVTCVVPIGVAGWLFTVSVPAAAVLTVAVLCAVVVPRFWDARLLRTGQTRWSAYEKLAADYLEATHAISVLRVFGAGRRIGEALAERGEHLHRRTMTQLRVSLVEAGASALALHLGTAVTIVVACAGVLGGVTPAGSVLLFLLCARECFRPVLDLSAYWHLGYQGLGAVKGIDEILTAHPAVVDTGTRTEPARAGVRLRLRNVDYRYPNGTGVTDVSFDCAPGSTTGIVGPSGAGKSTLARLIVRHADPQQGTIELDGTPITEYTLAALRASIGVVGQHTYLFHGTVEENLRLARPDATFEEVRTAAFIADALEFIEALPQGFATVLTENAVQLSGGQRQRLAIARAVLAATPVLLFDEATSALDVDTEQRVLTRLAEHCRGITRIVIAHRESALRDADVVVTIESGRVVSSVTPL
ncbi:ABC transporter ATP-binding protein/permease [Kibdelosporangium aridum]|uniref:ABC-type transport system involved in cytochrome bd biosynthesis, ATPase and permease components n=1 Tax=Kibdelosporangium aridum TaxID=2030 RepID=A0A1Y5Y9V6_KIBAR|nr:ATP-binding cassette domain-containing protein [Kibdelosporangium aridum]SMD27326.1 ABC-type transport system involved in cytochrome bd biosynthesis, ATPase and permease components [Kibdelosporangium aridum]